MTSGWVAARHLALGVVTLGWSNATVGCGTHDKQTAKACLTAKNAVGSALSRHDFLQARALRANAYRACDDAKALAAQDQSILDGENNLALAQTVSAQREAQKLALVRFFLDFVRDQRGAPDKASNAPRCTEGPEPFCTARRQAGSRHVFEVHYSARDPGAFRFTTSVEGSLDCAALSGTLTKSWSVPVPGGGTSQRSRCELGGSLSGLAAVVGSGSVSSLHVFSTSYLEHEPSARRSLDAPPP